MARRSGFFFFFLELFTFKIRWTDTRNIFNSVDILSFRNRYTYACNSIINNNNHMWYNSEKVLGLVRSEYLQFVIEIKAKIICRRIALDGNNVVNKKKKNNNNR